MIQLGTRWPAHTEPSTPKLPSSMVDAIHAVEAELRTLDVDTSAWYWTLTWLESRPRLELDDGTVIRQHADGEVTVSEPDA